MLTGNTVTAHGNSAATGSTAGAEGGAIYTDADLTIDSSIVELNSVVADNSDALVSTVFARGGGIFHLDGELTVRNSRVGANTATINDQSTDASIRDEAVGGGIFASNDAAIEQTSIITNGVSATGLTGSVSTKGAGIRIDGGGGSRIELSTINGNSAVGSGPGGTERRAAGALVVANPMPVIGSTIAGNGLNSLDTVGANLFAEAPGQANFSNTIVAEPVGATSGTSNCSGSVASNGFNVEYHPGSTTSSCSFTQATDLPDPSDVVGGTDPELNPLAANGGLGLTMLPLPGSPVVDKGSAASQTVADEDQRGLARPAFFSDISNPPLGDGADIGAAEIQIAPPTFTGTTPASPNLDDTPNVRGSVAADSTGIPTVRLFTNPSCTVLTGAPATPAAFAGPGIVSSPLPHNATTTFYGTVQTAYGISHCSTGVFPKTISYTQTDPPQPQTPASPPTVVTTSEPKTKCKKGFVKKRGKCVRKKRKKAAK